MNRKTKSKKSRYFNGDSDNVVDESQVKQAKIRKIQIDNPSSANLIGKKFFVEHNTIDLARKLLGKFLCRKIDDSTVIKGIIVETEAYLGIEDHASYTFGGRRTNKNEPMYMEPGTCFIRLLYGMYHCMNISSKDFGAAILLRALQPHEGIDKMIELRRKHPKAPKINFNQKTINKLANGPSKLCIAMNIDESINKLDIANNQEIWLEKNDSMVVNESDIIESTRIGINSSNPWSKKLLRYYLKENKSVSKF